MKETRWIAVTGATGAIGAQIAEQIARAPGFGVVLLVRRNHAGLELAERLRDTTENPSVRSELVDVSRKESIDAVASRWELPLAGLVNNAAVAPRQRQLTPEGLELQFATNVLAGLWAAMAFRSALGKHPGGCVVNVASYWAGDLDVTDLMFERRRYDNNLAYRQSKQCNRMLTVALAEELAPDAIRVHACHPGDVPSRLARDLGFGGSDSPESAARTPTQLALGELGADSTAGYFEHGASVPCRFGADRAAVATLWEACRRFLE